MPNYTYTDFFAQFPEIYPQFHAVVDHAGNFGAELEKIQFWKDADSFCSIGAGEGELELATADQHQLQFGYIDPTPQFVTKFKENLARRKLGFRCVDLHAGVFQHYLPAQAYDRVIAIHSWYALGYDQELLKKALSMLAPQGKLFITLVSKSSLTWKLSHLANSPTSGPSCSEELSEWATQQGFKHQYFLNHNPVRADRLLKDGSLTEEGRAFSSFLSFTPWNEMDQNLKNETSDLFHTEVKNGQIDLLCGCLIFEALPIREWEDDLPYTTLES